MQGMTNQYGVGRGAANGLLDRIGRNPLTRTSEYCDVARSTRLTRC
jgi:hypothetical protein